MNAGALVNAESVLLRTASPEVIGTARVGSRLTATASWRPSPTLRDRGLPDGKPIGAATARTYRLREADAGHRIAVREQTVRTGALSSLATSAAKRVAR